MRCAPRPRGGRAPCPSAWTCRSRASRRAGPASRARGRRRAPGRARRWRCCRRGARSALTSRSGHRPRGRAAGRAARRAAARRVGARSSTSVFHSPQPKGTGRAIWASARRRRSRRTRRSAWAPAEGRARGGPSAPALVVRPPLRCCARKLPHRGKGERLSGRPRLCSTASSRGGSERLLGAPAAPSTHHRGEGVSGCRGARGSVRGRGPRTAWDWVRKPGLIPGSSRRGRPRRPRRHRAVRTPHARCLSVRARCAVALPTSRAIGR